MTALSQHANNAKVIIGEQLLKQLLMTFLAECNCTVTGYKLQITLSQMSLSQAPKIL